MTSIKTNVKKICENVKIAKEKSILIPTKIKNEILLDVAKSIIARSNEIIEANKKDIEFSRKNNIDSAKIDRLILNEEKIQNLSKTLVEIAKLEDPVGKILFETERENNLLIRRISTPIGILFTIFESRPNVAIDVAALSFKSGNAVILRSGSESLNSSKILIEIMRNSLKKFNIDENLIYLVENSNRDYVKYLLKMHDYIDVVIPRGGKSLIDKIMKSTKIPIFKHLDGNCHTYIHQDADFKKAREILLNAKLRRTSICGATESLLIDKKIAHEILPLIAHDLYVNGCEMRGDKLSQKIDSRIKVASKKDFATEYLDKIISIKIVKNVDEAISHINKFSSSHTESIITQNQEAASKFLTQINSAIVMHNASTQFADGGEFGFGAEVGISTGKLHARGPVGLEQLTTYKYNIISDFAVRK